MIPASELIINQRGAIYHLDMHPDELANTVILVGDPDRVEKVSRHFDHIQHKTRHREFVSHTGTIGHKPLTVLSTGIGPDNIDIAINELDALANIDFESRTVKSNLSSLRLIRLGTSGALRGDIPVNSLVVSSHGLGFDNVLNFYEHEKTAKEQQLVEAFIQHTQWNTAITNPYIFESSKTLAGAFGNGFINGITITAPGFYGPQGRELRLRSRTREVMDRIESFSFEGHRIANFEMESSAIFGLGKLLGHQCVSVNVIVANRIIQQYSKDSHAAVDQLIEQSLEVIVQMD